LRHTSRRNPSQPANNSTEAAQPTEEPQPAEFTVTDGMGRTVTLKKHPAELYWSEISLHGGRTPSILS
jgi:ABC-type Fe3+-hydroxamate transport system substrate-binding protein